tara:strand:+ start:872 stop:1183 length:312 start_codon:yes stop_codon:yes gene_type:complete
MFKLLVLITTVPNKLLAKKIAKLLIERKLAACVSTKKINSYFKWDNKIEEEEEIELMIKTIPENLNELIKVLKEEISYELPQLIYQLFESEINYFNWVKDSVN